MSDNCFSNGMYKQASVAFIYRGVAKRAMLELPIPYLTIIAL